MKSKAKPKAKKRNSVSDRSLLIEGAESGETPHEDALCHRCDRSYNDIVHHNPSIALHHKFVPLPAAPSSVSDERERFEKWANVNGLSTYRFPRDGDDTIKYSACATEDMWSTWKAALAASRPDPARKLVGALEEMYQCLSVRILGNGADATHDFEFHQRCQRAAKMAREALRDSQAGSKV